MARKKKKYGYDVSDPFDRAMALDVPMSQLNKRGRKAKRKTLKKWGESCDSSHTWKCGYPANDFYETGDKNDDKWQNSSNK